MASVPIEEYQSRVARVRAQMREHGMDGLVITDAINYYYFSGQKVPPWMKARPAVFILPLEGEPAVINWSGPEMFARVYNKPYPTWVEDRRFYPEIPFTPDDTTDWGIRAVLEDRQLTDCVLGDRAGQADLVRHPVQGFPALTGRAAQGEVGRVRPGDLAMPDHQVRVGDRVRAQGLRNRRQGLAAPVRRASPRDLHQGNPSTGSALLCRGWRGSGFRAPHGARRQGPGRHVPDR